MLVIECVTSYICSMISTTTGPESTLPPHACEQIAQVIKLDAASVLSLTRISERLVVSGRMSPAEFALQKRVMGEARGEVIGYCATYCVLGGCALQQSGRELVNSNPVFLNPENKARYEFYQRVQEIEHASKGDYQD